MTVLLEEESIVYYREIKSQKNIKYWRSFSETGQEEGGDKEGVSTWSEKKSTQWRRTDGRCQGPNFLRKQQKQEIPSKPQTAHKLYAMQVYREMVENGELESDVREATCRYKTQDLRRHLRHTLNNTLIFTKSWKCQLLKHSLTMIYNVLLTVFYFHLFSEHRIRLIIRKICTLFHYGVFHIKIRIKI